MVGAFIDQVVKVLSSLVNAHKQADGTESPGEGSEGLEGSPGIR